MKIAYHVIKVDKKKKICSKSRKVMDGVHAGAVYEELISVRLVGMMLVIVVRQELRKNVIRYSTETVGTGALNFMVRTTYGSNLQRNFKMFFYSIR